MHWDWAFTWEILPNLLRGLVWTVVATLAGTSLALIIGLIWSSACRSAWWPVRRAAIISLHAIRNTPLLIQLYMFYYVAPRFGLTMPPLATGILALGLHYGTYAAEIYRAGIEAVDRGQGDAAAALGLNSWQRFRFVIVPQAIPPSIPALGNLFVAMFKEAPLLSAITVVELLSEAKLIGSATFRYLEPMTMVGVLFLIVSLMASIPIRWCERRFGVQQ